MSFQITKYLHIPTKKLLVKDIDFRHNNSRGLWDGARCIAERKDCVALLTREYKYTKYMGRINGVHQDKLIKQIWTMGDIGERIIPKRSLNKKEYGIFNTKFYEFTCYSSIFGLDFYEKGKLDSPKDYNNIASFFDDTAKYSKLLWNCSEEEGWSKIFKLLKIQ